MDLQVRMATSADYPELVKFWNQYAGWDEIDQEVWEGRFVHTPAGPSAIALAWLGEDLVGQLVFIPYRGQVGQKTIRMYRAFAAVLAPDRGLDHMGQVQISMFFESARFLTERQADLIYILPDPRWRAFFSRYGALQMEHFPLYSKTLQSGEAPASLPGFQTEQIQPDDERIDAVWRQAADHFLVSAVKDKKYFQWKSAGLGYDLFIVQQGDRPVGLFALMNKGDQTTCMIAELLSNGDLIQQKAVLSSAVNEALKRSMVQKKLQKTGIMALPGMIPMLEELGFQPDDYTYIMILFPLNEQYGEQLINIANWHLSAGD